MTLEDRVRHFIGDILIQLHAAKARVEELESELKSKIEGGAKEPPE